MPTCGLSITTWKGKELGALSAGQSLQSWPTPAGLVLLFTVGRHRLPSACFSFVGCARGPNVIFVLGSCSDAFLFIFFFGGEGLIFGHERFI